MVYKYQCVRNIGVQQLKPYKHSPGIFVDIQYNLHLPSTLADILLVDAHLINLQVSFFVRKRE